MSDEHLDLCPNSDCQSSDVKTTCWYGDGWKPETSYVRCNECDMKGPGVDVKSPMGQDDVDAAMDEARRIWNALPRESKRPSIPGDNVTMKHFESGVKRSTDAEDVAACGKDSMDSEGRGVDMVNHPQHYTSHPSGVECIEVTRHYGFNVGNAIKYLWRAGLKGDAIEDLRKAAWYINDEIARREKEASK